MSGTTNFSNVSTGTVVATALSASGYAFPKSILGTLTYTQFGTVNGSVAVGTIAGTIPAGATFYRTAVTSIGGFQGSPNAGGSAVIGDGTDVDRYTSATAFDVFTTAANGIDVGAPSGTAYHTTGSAPVVRITMGTLWGSVTSGTITAKFYYFD